VLAVGVCGSPRAGGNTEALLNVVLEGLRRHGFETRSLLLRDLRFSPCTGCRGCVGKGSCIISDDFTRVATPALLSADVVVVASPVYFNNVSALTKAFIDRTWCLRGRLRFKVGGAVVVGRGYGAELAITAIHAFMLKHEMILAHRGVHGEGYEAGEVLRNGRALRDARRLAEVLARVAEATAALRGALSCGALNSPANPMLKGAQDGGLDYED